MTCGYLPHLKRFELLMDTGTMAFITFADLGIPFPLFEGPTDQASEYCGVGTCTLCGNVQRHCFRLDIGCAVIMACPNCGAENGLDASDCEETSCRVCRSMIPFPDFGDDEILACFECLRAGKAALTKDTVLGMISWEQAFEGVTHGNPSLNRTDFEMVPKREGWIGARLPHEMMFELLRTPTYMSIQGERWQFCCRKPMVFLGRWEREDFHPRAPDADGRKLFDEIIQRPVPGLWEDELHDITGIYVFRCTDCNRLTAHWDLA
jgi:uncharacterized protein CbrC (UPF0167 family)